MHNIKELKENLPMFIKRGYFSNISFDNLAILQLDVKELLFKDNEEEWSKFYMGDDGGFTMYIDAVNYKYAKNSCMSEDERFDMNGKTVQEMFQHIQDLYGEVPEVSSDESES
jgi:hypothetical protein